MKKSELTKIIKEEVQNILKEAKPVEHLKINITDQSTPDEVEAEINPILDEYSKYYNKNFKYTASRISHIHNLPYQWRVQKKAESANLEGQLYFLRSLGKRLNRIEDLYDKYLNLNRQSPTSPEINKILTELINMLSDLPAKLP